MTRELHIDYSELAHGEEYESEFMELYTPSQSCAIRTYIPQDYYNDYEWEKVFYSDLEALGIKPGERVWVEIDY